MNREMPCFVFNLAKPTSGGDALELVVYDTIGGGPFGGGVSARAIAEQLATSAAKTINVRINSRGGDVFDAVAIHNALSRHKARKVVTVDGVALSAASVVAMAGDEISMPENALMMIHNPWGIAVGGSEDLRKTADVLERCKDQIVSTYAARTKRPVKEITAMMKAETWMNGTEAVAKGFADKTTGLSKIAASFSGAGPRNYQAIIGVGTQPSVSGLTIAAVSAGPWDKSRNGDKPDPGVARSLAQAQSEREWDAKSPLVEGIPTRERYVRFRTNELIGQIH